MWKMLLSGNSGAKTVFSGISANSTFAIAHWDATYVFSATGNYVENHVDAVLELSGGKILFHKDSFPFYQWSSMALGGVGLVLGWTSALQRKVQTGAYEKLLAFHQQNVAGDSSTTATTTTPTPVATPVPEKASPAKTIVFVERFSVPAAQLWSIVKNWEDPTWTGIIKSSTCNPPVTPSSPATVGNVRTITFTKSPNTYNDELLHFDDKEYHIEWRQVDTPMPITEHFASLTISADGEDACFLEWSNSYDIKPNTPPEAVSYVASAFSNLSKVATRNIRNLLKGSDE